MGFSCLFFEPAGWGGGGSIRIGSLLFFSVKLNGEVRVGGYHSVTIGVYMIHCAFTDLTDACDTGCNEDTCLNNGYCNEHWRYGNFTCDCSETDFAGKICEKGETVTLS